VARASCAWITGGTPVPPCAHLCRSVPRVEKPL